MRSTMFRILSWLPTILQSVFLVESVFSGRLKGSQKKEMAIDIVFSALGLAGVPITEKYVAQVSELIDSTVEQFNHRELFPLVQGNGAVSPELETRLELMEHEHTELEKRTDLIVQDMEETNGTITERLGDTEKEVGKVKKEVTKVSKEIKESKETK